MAWNLGKTLRDEGRLVLRYIREVRQHQGALLSGTVVAGLMSLAVAFLEWSNREVPSWAYVTLFVTLVVIAQYLAWRALAKRHDAEEPETPPGFVVTTARPKEARVSAFDRGPDGLVATVQIATPAPVRIDLFVLCSAPILAGDLQYRIHFETDRGTLHNVGFQAQLDVLRPRYGVFRMRGEEVSAGNSFEIRIYSKSEIQLQKLDVEPINGVTPPRDLPLTTVSGQAPPP